MTTYPAMQVCGVRVDALDADAAADEIIRRAGTPAAVHLCNAYTLSLATQDEEFGELLNRGDLNLPDGMPLVWIARRLGIDLAGRAYGPDVMAAAIDRGRDHGARHYFYGSTPEVLAALVAQVRRRWPGVQIAGAESPPFRDLSLEEEHLLVDRIGDAEAQVVWIGLGTPKQDLFIARFRDEVPSPLVAVGAAFDFHAGAKRQAPVRFRELGLEWLWRLASEPRRLARRYLVGNVTFLLGLRGGVSRIPPHPEVHLGEEGAGSDAE